jgi:hypothetical protein
VILPSRTHHLGRPSIPDTYPQHGTDRLSPVVRSCGRAADAPPLYERTEGSAERPFRSARRYMGARQGPEVHAPNRGQTPVSAGRRPDATARRSSSKSASATSA